MYLLVLFLFTMQPNGDFKEFTVMTKGYTTLSECNEAGRFIARTMPVTTDVKSLSYCVGPEDYAN